MKAIEANFPNFSHLIYFVRESAKEGCDFLNFYCSIEDNNIIKVAKQFETNQYNVKLSIINDGARFYRLYIDWSHLRSSI